MKMNIVLMLSVFFLVPVAGQAQPTRKVPADTSTDLAVVQGQIADFTEQNCLQAGGKTKDCIERALEDLVELTHKLDANVQMDWKILKREIELPYFLEDLRALRAGIGRLRAAIYGANYSKNESTNLLLKIKAHSAKVDSVIGKVFHMMDRNKQLIKERKL